MNKAITTILISIIISATQHASIAQKATACMDSQIHKSLVNQNMNWEKKGYSLHTMTQFLMPNATYAPTSIETKKGKTYQVSYMPEAENEKILLIIIDKDKKEIVKLNAKSTQLMTATFTSTYDGAYHVIVSQKGKDQEVACAGLSVMVK